MWGECMWLWALSAYSDMVWCLQACSTIHQYHYCRFRCNICDKAVRCDHMGKRNVIKHFKSQCHRERAKSLNSQSTLNFQIMKLLLELRLKWEWVLTATCNIPLAFHDQLSPALGSVFSDLKIASKNHSASTKATCMLNLAVAPMLVQILLDSMNTHPFFSLWMAVMTLDSKKWIPLRSRYLKWTVASFLICALQWAQHLRHSTQWLMADF